MKHPSEGQQYVNVFLASFRKQHEHEPEFVQSVEELVGSLTTVLDERADLRQANILERLCQPERCIQFRVAWLADL